MPVSVPARQQLEKLRPMALWMNDGACGQAPLRRLAVGDHGGMHLELIATATGAEMVLRRRDGAEYSGWAIAEEDLLVALERIEAGETTPSRPWSLEALDAALEREGYRRTSDWWPGDGGPCCQVTR